MADDQQSMVSLKYYNFPIQLSPDGLVLVPAMALRDEDVKGLYPGQAGRCEEHEASVRGCNDFICIQHAIDYVCALDAYRKEQGHAIPKLSTII